MKILLCLGLSLLSFYSLAEADSWYIDLNYGFVQNYSASNYAKDIVDSTNHSSKLKTKYGYGYGVLFTLDKLNMLGVSRLGTVGKYSGGSNLNDLELLTEITGIKYNYFITGEVGDGSYVQAILGQGAVYLNDSDGSASKTIDKVKYGAGYSIGIGTTFSRRSVRDWLYLEFIYSTVNVGSGSTWQSINFGFCF